MFFGMNSKILTSLGTDNIAIVGTLALGIGLYLYMTSSNLPLANARKPFELSYSSARKRFIKNAESIITSALVKASVFQVVADNGQKLVLAGKYANEIGSHEALSLPLAVGRDYHSHITGFEVFGQTLFKGFQDAIRMKLPRALGNLVEPMAEEAGIALQAIWTENTDWHHLVLAPSLLNIISQVSSRAFVGNRLCRNPDWIRLVSDYTIHVFTGAHLLRPWPKLLRPLVAKFHPYICKVQSELQEARDILEPILAERRARKAVGDGKDSPHYNDTLEWVEECANEPYDAAAVQMLISIAAIHTTLDMLTQAIYDICQEDGLIDELREEIISVIREGGWTKASLHQMRLLDSVLKESQRLKPAGITSLLRVATANTALSDGTRIPKDSLLVVSCERMWDPDVYPDPRSFDPYRFLRMRELVGNEVRAQAATPSSEHMGFGLGKHACTGRGFVVNEMKIIMSHILLKYDLKLVDTPVISVSGTSTKADTKARIAVRRRKEEISL